MSPLGHLALGVLAGRWRAYGARGRRLCLFGAFLPDLVDKPLGHLGVTPSFHSVGHSLPVLIAVALVAVRVGRGAPVVLGWTTHLVGDLPLAVPAYLDHYVWPLLAPPAPPAEPVGRYVLDYATGPAFGAEVLLACAAAWTVARGSDAG